MQKALVSLVGQPENDSVSTDSDDVDRSQRGGSHGMQRIYSQIENRTLLFYIMFICLKLGNGALHVLSAGISLTLQ